MKPPITAMPLRGPLNVRSPFGRRVHPVTGEESFHHGVDLRAAEGTPVFAPFDGVARSFVSDTGGNIVQVTAFDGWSTNLDHLSRVDVGVGPTSVPAGAQLGLSGSTGRVTGPHLHFELRPPPVNGQRQDPIDPLPFLLDGGSAVLLVLATVAGYSFLS